MNEEFLTENTVVRETVAAETETAPKAVAESVPEPAFETAPEAAMDTSSELPVDTAPEAAMDTAPEAPVDTAPEAPVDTASEASAEKSEPENSETMEDYSREIESSLRKIYEGDVMEGEVIAFNEHGVILDLNYYATGRVPVEEMSADPSFNIMTDVTIGDRFTAIVTSVDDGKGNILLSKKAAESEYSWDKLRTLKEEGAVISGTISEVVRSGAIMYVEGIRGFIPASKLSVKYVEDTAPYLGRNLRVKVFEVDEEQKKLILSAKELATEEYVKQQAETISRYSVGSIVSGKVESLQNYGAFIDLGDDISGLLHISEISHQRIKHPKAVLKTGQEVTVMITKIENGKISLSMKAIQEAQEKEVEEEAHEYRSEYIPNNPFADLLKDFMK